MFCRWRVSTVRGHLTQKMSCRARLVRSVRLDQWLHAWIPSKLEQGFVAATRLGREIWHSASQHPDHWGRTWRAWVRWACRVIYILVRRRHDLRIMRLASQASQSGAEYRQFALHASKELDAADAGPHAELSEHLLGLWRHFDLEFPDFRRRRRLPMVECKPCLEICSHLPGVCHSQVSMLLQDHVDPGLARVARTFLTSRWWHNGHVADRDVRTREVNPKCRDLCGPRSAEGPEEAMAGYGFVDAWQYFRRHSKPYVRTFESLMLTNTRPIVVVDAGASKGMQY